MDSAISAIDLDLYNRPDFRTDYENAKFFIIKSFSEDNVHKSIKYNVWASTPHGNKKLDAAYCEAKEKKETCPVFLLFSGAPLVSDAVVVVLWWFIKVKASGHSFVISSPPPLPGSLYPPGTMKWILLSRSCGTFAVWDPLVCNLDSKIGDPDFGS
ncbi:YTH domain - like 8 [Theobroma cacao]|nr:YTH domain - like 8 [Theobroma cacao]